MTLHVVLLQDGGVDNAVKWCEGVAVSPSEMTQAQDSLADQLQRVIAAADAAGEYDAADWIRRTYDVATSRRADITYLDTQEFRDEGYLQEANRRFFHPLGLALEVVTDETGRAVRLGGIWDERSDPEGVMYGPKTMDPVKAANVDKIWSQRQAGREAALGYMVQPVGPAPHA